MTAYCGSPESCIQMQLGAWTFGLPWLRFAAALKGRSMSAQGIALGPGP